MGRRLVAGVAFAALVGTAGELRADTFQRIAIFERDMSQLLKEPNAIPLGPQETTITADWYWVITATGPRNGQTAQYCIIVGPDPVSGGPWTFKIASRYSGAETSLTIISGVAYYVGTLTYGGTDGGSAAAQGTRFVAWGRNRDQADPIALIEGFPLIVTNVNDTSETATISVPNSYCEVFDGGSIGPVKSIDQDRELDNALRARLWELARLVDYAMKELAEEPACECPGLASVLP